MKRTMIRRLLGGLALLTLSGTLASAATITWYNNIFSSPDPTNGPASNSPLGPPTAYTAPFSTTVEIPKFDQTSPNAGMHYVLNSVTIVMTWLTTGNVTVQNNDTTSSHEFTNATSSVPLSIFGPAGVTINGTALAGPANGSVAAANQVIFDPFCPAPTGCTVNSQTTISGLTGNGSSNNTVIGGALAAYQGFGSAVLSFGSSAGSANFGGTQTGGSGNLFFGGNATVASSITVTYDYSEIANAPEPGTFGAIGSGLAALAFYVRRRRK